LVLDCTRGVYNASESPVFAFNILKIKRKKQGEKLGMNFPTARGGNKTRYRRGKGVKFGCIKYSGGGIL